jgi:DnaJ-class molecular chaperone
VEYGGDPGNLGDFSEFFRSIFGDLGAHARRGSRSGGIRFDEGFDRTPRGADVEAGIEISLDEAFQGARKTFAMDLEEPCAVCGGSGNVQGKPCAACGGGGWQRAQRHVDVKIPAGVKSGQRVRVSGEGTGAPGARGDLYLSVTVAAHPFFERKGDDVHLTLPITAPEAALGTSIEVPTLRGKVSMKVPPATSSGRTFRLPGYGMPRLKGGGAGDQFVAIKVVMPSELTPEERELYEKLKALRSDNPRAYLG